MADLFQVGDLKAFTPTNGLLKKILAVRVAPPSTSVSHPGLLSISNYGTDLLWAFGGAVFELLGLLVILYYAVWIRKFSPLVVVPSVLIFLLLDIFFMFFHHHFAVTKNKILEFENAVFKGSEVDAEKRATVDNGDTIARNKAKSRIFVFLLLIVAAMKIVGVIWMIPIGRNEGFPFPVVSFILVIYIGAALIHIYRTGYAWSGMVAKNVFSKELILFSKNGNVANEVPEKDSRPLQEHTIFSRPEIQSIEADSHFIEENKMFGTPNQQKYNLNRIGILKDVQISAWEAKTKDRTGAGAALTRSAMRLQLAMFTGVR